MNPKSWSNKKDLWSACLGNLFEHYDNALFGLLSPFLAPLIFPKQAPMTALLLTYAMIPLGMLARPLGSLVLGYIGDVYGRKQALFVSLMGMALVSLGMALTPIYSHIGWIAPLIFCIARALQNFLAAGESMGGAIFLLENAPKSKHDLLSSVYNASTLAGILIASLGVTLLGLMGHVEKSWRVLYLIGSITGLFGTFLRKGFSKQSGLTTPTRLRHTLIPFFVDFWTFKRPLILIAISAGFAYANYTMALVLMNGFIPLISPHTKESMMTLNTALLILDFSTLPLFGWISSKITKEKLMLGASVGVVILGIPLFMLLEQASFAAIVVVRIALVLFGVAFFAPFHAWAQELVPETKRYRIISMGYALGSQLIGGPTAALSLALFKKTGMIPTLSYYWLLLGLIVSGILLSSYKKKSSTLSPAS